MSLQHLADIHQPCGSRPLYWLPTLPHDVLWEIMRALPYHDCWRFIFVSRAMREFALAYLEHSLKYKFGRGGWTLTFETFLNCRHTLYELDPHADFSATGLHFDTRTLDICASLDGDNQRIMHVCSNCEPTVSVDFTLTMRRPVTSCRQHEGEAGAQLERPVGTGWRTPWRDLLTAGTPAQREWEPAVQKYTNVAAVELRAGRGEWFRPFVGYALYNAWHEVRVQGGYQQRGGYVFWEVKATAPAFLREMDEMEAVLDRGDPWDELDYLVKGKGKGKGKGKEKVMMDLKTKLAKKARGNSRRFSGTRSLPMDTPSTKPMDEYSWGHLEELFGKF